MRTLSPAHDRVAVDSINSYRIANFFGASHGCPCIKKVFIGRSDVLDPELGLSEDDARGAFVSNLNALGICRYLSNNVTR